MTGSSRGSAAGHTGTPWHSTWAAATPAATASASGWEDWCVNADLRPLCPAWPCNAYVQDDVAHMECAMPRPANTLAAAARYTNIHGLHAQHATQWWHHVVPKAASSKTVRQTSSTSNSSSTTHCVTRARFGGVVHTPSSLSTCGCSGSRVMVDTSLLNSLISLALSADCGLSTLMATP